MLYVVAGPLTWVAMLAGTLMGRVRMGRLLSWNKPLPAGQTPPHVTVIIPVKDEGPGIRRCVESVLAQDYPSFDVITVDDRSRDDTGQILDQIAASSPARHPLKVIHVAPDGLPAGWLGKTHALHQGQKLATGSWLLFVDSDVSLSPNALTSTMSIALAREYDAVSLLTRLVCDSFIERLMMPLLAGGWSIAHVVSMTNEDTRKDVAAANGQFFLIHREAYDGAGGHESVKQGSAEDVDLMRRMKQRGSTVRFFMGPHLASTRMYATLRQMFQGWGRIYSGTTQRRPWRILAAMWFTVVSIVSAYPALAWGIHVFASRHQWPWLAGASAHLVLMTFVLALIYAWSGNPRRYALLAPISAPIFLAAMAYALRKCQTGRIIWRATEFFIPRGGHADG